MFGPFNSYCKALNISIAQAWTAKISLKRIKTQTQNSTRTIAQTQTQELGWTIATTEDESANWGVITYEAYEINLNITQADHKIITVIVPQTSTNLINKAH